jgi:hypothetical protein
MVIDFKFAQIRLLGFFSLMIKDHKDDIFQHCSSFASKVISLLNCNISADVSGLRIELLSGFESLILIDYKYGIYKLIIFVTIIENYFYIN